MVLGLVLQRLPGLLADDEPAGSEAVDGAPTAWGIHVTQHVLKGSDDPRLSRDLMTRSGRRADFSRYMDSLP